uniref:Cyclin N-terminal domain-containing protein n=1 Tax=Panagrellus redivivus TaxID=6233 RepID=A0A7E4ZX05_PANRE
MSKGQKRRIKREASDQSSITEKKPRLSLLQGCAVKNEVKAEPLDETKHVESKPALSGYQEWRPIKNPTDTEAAFIFTDDMLQNSPSFRVHQISAEYEHRQRVLGSSFIIELANNVNCELKQYNDASLPSFVEALLRGRKLKKTFIATDEPIITQKATHTAMIYLNRFYMFHSLSTFDSRYIATAALFLACKVKNCEVEDKTHRQYPLGIFTKHLYFALNGRNEFDLDDAKLISTLILDMEELLLKTFSVVSYVESPLEVIVRKAGFLGRNFETMQKAFSICGKMLQFTTLILRHRAVCLAAAALAIICGVGLRKTYGDNWFYEFDPTLTLDILRTIIEEYRFVYGEVVSKLRLNPISGSLVDPMSTYLRGLVTKEVRISTLKIIEQPKADFKRPSDEEVESSLSDEKNSGWGGADSRLESFAIDNYWHIDMDAFREESRRKKEFRHQANEILMQYGPDAPLELYPYGILTNRDD